MKLKKHIFLVIIAIIFLSAGSYLCYLGTFPGISIEKLSYQSIQDGKTPVNLSALFIKSNQINQTKKPTIIFIHGLGADKEIYLTYYRCWAQEGLNVLAIDLKGHGQSEGYNDFGYAEIFDVYSAIDYLSKRNDVDLEKIVVSGHSLGGINSTRAGIFDKTKKIKAVMSITCWESFKKGVDYIFGENEGYLRNVWPFLAWSRRFDINNPSEMKKREIYNYINTKVPPNYLLLIGAKDELIPVEAEKRIMEKAVGAKEIISGKIYGNFSQGTARMLKITPDDTHYSETNSNQIFFPTLDWLSQSLKLKKMPHKDLDNFRLYGFILILAGIILSVFPLQAGLRKSLGIFLIKIEKKFKEKSIPLFISLVVISYFISSFFSYRLAKFLHFRAIIPNLIADAFTVYTISKLIIFVPLLFILIIIFRKKISPLRESLGFANRKYFNSSLYGFIPFVWIFALINLFNYFFIFPLLIPKRITSSLILLLLLLIYFIFEEITFRGIIQTRLSSMKPAGEVVISTLVSGVIGCLSATLGSIYLFPSIGYHLHLAGKEIAFLPFLLIINSFIFLFHGFVASLFYHRTRNIMTSIIFLTFFLTWIFSTFFPRCF